MIDFKKLNKYKKSEINALTKLFNGLRLGTTDTKTVNQRVFNKASELGLQASYDSQFTLFLFEKPKKIESSQTVLGKNWLKQHFFKTSGQPRTGKNTKNVSERVLSISKSVSKFEFIGLLALENGMGELSQFLPIYRTYNRAGQYFDYSPIHWGQPVIMEGN